MSDMFTRQWKHDGSAGALSCGSAGTTAGRQVDLLLTDMWGTTSPGDGIEHGAAANMDHHASATSR